MTTFFKPVCALRVPEHMLLTLEKSQATLVSENEQLVAKAERATTEARESGANAMHVFQRAHGLCTADAFERLKTEHERLKQSVTQFNLDRAGVYSLSPLLCFVACSTAAADTNSQNAPRRATRCRARSAACSRPPTASSSKSTA